MRARARGAEHGQGRQARDDEGAGGRGQGSQAEKAEKAARARPARPPAAATPTAATWPARRHGRGRSAPPTARSRTRGEPRTVRADARAARDQVDGGRRADDVGRTRRTRSRAGRRRPRRRRIDAASARAVEARLHRVGAEDRRRARRLPRVCASSGVKVATRITVATAVVVALASAAYAFFDLRSRGAERRAALEREARAVATTLRVRRSRQRRAFAHADGARASSVQRLEGDGAAARRAPAIRPATGRERRAQLRRLRTLLDVPG